MNVPAIPPNAIPPNTLNGVPPQLLTQQTLAMPETGDSMGTFSALVTDMLKNTQKEQQQVDLEANRLMTGEASSFHEVSLAVARADISFRFMMEVRDQLVGAYREVMRMQV